MTPDVDRAISELNIDPSQLNDAGREMLGKVMTLAVHYSEDCSEAYGREAMSKPSVLMRPELSILPDNSWCAMYGHDETSDAVMGFGASPAEAMQDFDRKWFQKLGQGT